MDQQRPDLPQLGDDLFITDGGLETSLIYHDNFVLPHSAAFLLLSTESGTAALDRYYRRYVEIARTHGVGIVLESPTWRASPDWGVKLGFGRHALTALNRRAIAELARLRDELEADGTPVVISGCIGPRGDGYRADQRMTPEEAARYHEFQIEAFRDTAVDLVSALTQTHAEEALGITWAAAAADLPVAISFTVEPDGRLPSGQPLGEAIEMVDREAGRTPAYYMINCAHPEHFAHTLRGAPWATRIRGVRANASNQSHAELDAALELDDGDPDELGRQFQMLRDRYPQLNVLGGCCGTDHRHVDAICRTARA